MPNIFKKWNAQRKAKKAAKKAVELAAINSDRENELIKKNLQSHVEEVPKHSKSVPSDTLAPKIVKALNKINGIVTKHPKWTISAASSKTLINLGIKIDELTKPSPEVTAIKKNPSILLKDNAFQNLVTNQSLWKAVRKEKRLDIAKEIVSRLKLPKGLRKAAELSAAGLVDEIAPCFLKNGGQSIQKTIQNIAVSIDPNEKDTSKKMKSLADILNHSEDLIKIAMSENLFELIKHKKNALADFAVSKLNLPKEQQQGATQLITNLVGDAVSVIPNQKQFVQDIVQHAAVLADPKSLDVGKMNSLTYILNNSTKFVDIATSPEIWELIKYKQKDIADFAISKLDLPEGQQQEATQLITKLVGDAISAIPNQKQFVQDIIQHAAVLTDPMRSDVNKKDSLTYILNNSTKFVGLATSPEIWELIKYKQKDIADFAVSKLDLPENQQQKATRLITKLVGDAVSAIPDQKQFVQDIVQHAAVLADPKSSDVGKMNSLTYILNNSTKFVDIATSPEIWELIKYKQKDIADFAISKLDLPEGQQEKAKLLITDLVDIASVISKDQNKKLIENMVENLAIVVDPIRSDVTKITQSFKLFEQGIQFIESNKNVLQTLQKHKGVIAEVLLPYMPAGIKPEQIVNTLLEEKTFAALKKAYEKYRDSKYHAVGVVKAVFEVLKSSEIRSLAATVVANLVVSILPNFFRRIHANGVCKKMFDSRASQDTDLSKLCEAHSLGQDAIVKYSFKSRCLKGLNIPSSLDGLTIEKFNFQGAILGESDKPFSLANSKISETNFKNTQFKGNQIDISGMKIDGDSLATLFPLIERAQKVKIDKSIEITNISNEIRAKIENSELYKKNPDKFQFVSMRKEKASGKTVDKNEQKNKQSSMSFVKKLHEARKIVRNQKIR